MHLKISYIGKDDEECVVYKHEVPDTKKSTNSNSNSTIAAGTGAVTNQPASATPVMHHHGLSNGRSGSGGGGGVHNNTTDGIVITLDKPLSGDIKVEFYMKTRISRRKTLFSFWFNTFFESERETDGKLNKRIEKFRIRKSN